MVRGNTPRHASIAVDESVDVVNAVKNHLALLHGALRDGRVTFEEMQDAIMHVELVLTEALKAVQAAERADVGELLMLSNLKGERPSPSLVNRARDLDLTFAIIAPEPTPIRGYSPKDAA